MFVSCEYGRQEEDAQNIQCLRNRQSPRRRLQQAASSTESLCDHLFLLLIRGLRVLHLFPHKTLLSSTECSSGPRVHKTHESRISCECVSLFLSLVFVGACKSRANSEDRNCKRSTKLVSLLLRFASSSYPETFLLLPGGDSCVQAFPCLVILVCFAYSGFFFFLPLQCFGREA